MAALGSGTVMLVVVAAAAAWGCCRTRGSWPTDTWPDWSRALPRAVLAALLLMFAGGAAVLATGLALNLERMRTLLDGPRRGGHRQHRPAGRSARVRPECDRLGRQLRDRSGLHARQRLDRLAGRHRARRVAGDPFLTAVPDVGPGGVSHLWWLALGVAAGAVAATLVVLARPTARFDETTLVGGLSGVLAGVAFTGVAWLTSGDLGSDLLSGLGPQLIPVLVMSTSTMGLSGAICGLVLGLWRRRPRGAGEEQTPTGAAAVDATATMTGSTTGTS